MSGAYVYEPSSYYPTPYTQPFYSVSPHSPFVPPAHLYPSSPYNPSSPLPDVAGPNTPVTFEGATWDNLPPRPRRPSWHAPLFSAPPSPSSPYLGLPPPALGHNRRHSFGNTPFATYPWPGWGSPFHSAPASPLYGPAQTFIHPFLNGELPRPDFIFDLSSPSFNPLRVVAPGRSQPLTQDECAQPATHPGTTRMRITCDAVPQWPVILEYQDPYGYGAAVPERPITLGDVLIGIHRTLQRQVSHLDWGRLTPSEETAIARAYTRRCRSQPSLAHVEYNQGVRRVDYLLDRFMFKGLVRASGEPGWENMKMLI